MEKSNGTRNGNENENNSLVLERPVTGSGSVDFRPGPRPGILPGVSVALLVLRRWRFLEDWALIESSSLIWLSEGSFSAG